MAPNDKTRNSTVGIQTLTGDHVNEDQNVASTNAQGQTLVKALQDLIVRVMDPKQKNDVNQIHLGPEAGKLITALQELISSIVQSQVGAQRTVEVSLVEEGNEPQGARLDDGGEASLKDSGSLRELSSFPQWTPRLTLQKSVLKELKEHVFNTMPIRLLCFEPHGESGLKITLLERGAIYGRLATMLQGKMQEEDFRSTETRWGLETNKEIAKRLISKYAQYAILSHTWLRTTSGEVNFSNWNRNIFDTKNPGYRKLVNFCKAAWKDHQLTFSWMDTVCINKDSSSELDESIRSMYNWYSCAAVCLIYLSETDTLSNMHFDPWFTCGWTLQELVAPDVIKFYNGHWQQLVDNSVNDKNDNEITEKIERATTISKDELDNIHQASISRRMQLAATREVTREEDTAYSLMGIFDISISIAYGEGAPRAFFRLLQEILVSSKHVLDILNWAGELPLSRPHNSRILPASPKNYINRSSNKSLILSWPTAPLTLLHMGLRVPVILMPGISILSTLAQQSRNNTIGDYNATVFISPVGDYKYLPTTYNLLDKRISGQDGQKKDNNRYHWQITFAVFNFIGTPNIIYLPKTCIAIGLQCSEVAGELSTTGAIQSIITINTNKPIVFKLDKRIDGTQVGENHTIDAWLQTESSIPVKPDDLVKHGMRQINLYL